MNSLIGISATKANLLVDIFDTGGQITLKGGAKLWTPDDSGFSGTKTIDQQHAGIRPRWARVLAIGDDAGKDGLHLGDIVLCDTMKWARKVPFQRRGFGSEFHFWRIPVEDVLLVQEQTDQERDTWVSDYTAELTQAREAHG